MLRLSARLQAYVSTARGSATEFVLIFPLLFAVLTGLVDASNVFADYRQAQQVAESIVRTARSFDEALETTTARPLSDRNVTILRNVAARLQSQAPGGVNYVWIGRFVRPVEPINGRLAVQLLPGGLSATTNVGLIFVGIASHALNANRDAYESIVDTIAPGEMIYVAVITFSRQLLTPVPERRVVFSVRYSL